MLGWTNTILQGKDPVSTEFLLATLTDTDVKPYVTGAAQPKINQANLNRIPVMVSDEVTLRRFDDIVLSCFDERQLLIKKNDNLRTTRNLLLPKLISGKLNVEDLDIEVDEAALATVNWRDNSGIFTEDLRCQNTNHLFWIIVNWLCRRLSFHQT